MANQTRLPAHPYTGLTVPEWTVPDYVTQWSATIQTDWLGTHRAVMLAAQARPHVATAMTAPVATAAMAVLRAILGQPMRIQALHNGSTGLRTGDLATGTYRLTVQVSSKPAVMQCVLVE